MEEQEFMDKISNLSRPEVGDLKHQGLLKLTILNAKKSASIGVWMVVVPCYFLFCVVMKHFFKSDMSFLSITEEFFAGLDKNPNTRFLSPVLFVILPIFSIVINALSILHFDYDKGGKELIITLKLRWLNILLVALSLAIVLTFVAYLITENLIPKH